MAIILMISPATKLPNCAKCGLSLVDVDAFLLLTCEDIVCNHCTRINQGQAFCPIHEQQSIGQFLEDVNQDLKKLKTMRARQDQTGEDTLCVEILSKLKGGRERMGKFRQKSQKFNSLLEQETTNLQRLRSKFNSAFDFSVSVPTQPTEPQVEDNYVICKICFRVNPEEVKVCPGCKERDYKIVWRCRGCETRNQNGIVVCQQCRREDEYQVQLFRKKPNVH